MVRPGVSLSAGCPAATTSTARRAGTPLTDQGKQIMELLILVALLVAVAFNIWLFVVGVQFLRTGTQAFKAYLAAQHAAARTPVVPTQPERRPWDGR